MIIILFIIIKVIRLDSTLFFKQGHNWVMLEAWKPPKIMEHKYIRKIYIMDCCKDKIIRNVLNGCKEKMKQKILECEEKM